MNTEKIKKLWDEADKYLESLPKEERSVERGVGFYDCLNRQSTLSKGEGKEDVLFIKVGDIIQPFDRQKLSEDIFEVDTPDYKIQITNDNGNFFVSNAVNGWGNNCKKDFEKSEVTFLQYYRQLPTSQPEGVEKEIRCVNCHQPMSSCDCNNKNFVKDFVLSLSHDIEKQNSQLQKEVEYWKALAEVAEKLIWIDGTSPNWDKHYDHYIQLINQKQ